MMKGKGASKAVVIDSGIIGTKTCIQTKGNMKLVIAVANEYRRDLWDETKRIFCSRSTLRKSSAMLSVSRALKSISMSLFSM